MLFINPMRETTITKQSVLQVVVEILCEPCSTIMQVTVTLSRQLNPFA
eukprot:COSAG03_NODE_627_length_6647_cov_68.678375_3_plen_48_part_00